MTELERIKQQFDTVGAVVVPAVFHNDLIEQLLAELEIAIAEDLQLRPDVFDAGMVHNCMTRGKTMLALLDHPVLNSYLSELFTPHCIVYAYQSSSLHPSEGNYGSRIHVDCPRFIPDYVTNIGVIIPLTDFTAENGATYYLAGSHRQSELPSEQGFYAQAQRLVCCKGDLILFNARLAHAAGINTTPRTRHALTINLCRPYMRQRFDFPRLMSKQQIESLGENGRKLIGMNVRMPVSLDEFYLPVDQRLYKPGQE
jgi:ectoine hydroxylase-related dioxygenase (phytanoyl-CoA dioxygenase family)